MFSVLPTYDENFVKPITFFIWEEKYNRPSHTALVGMIKTRLGNTSKVLKFERKLHNKSYLSYSFQTSQKSPKIVVWFLICMTKKTSYETLKQQIDESFLGAYLTYFQGASDVFEL